jgi:CubicO group peptidase (beta-lactamase class C family)
MTKPITPQAILDRWAKSPLDFAPGSKWQYSNTGYTAVGLIAELVAKEPLYSFEQRRLFRPLGMNVVVAATGLADGDARGTTRYALGPVRAAPGEGAGWAFAAGDLAMSPSELAKWNIARLTHAVLKPDSWKIQETSVAPPGAKYQYGLGVSMDTVGQHPRIRHDGAWSAYLSSNRVYPADHASISVFINSGFSNSEVAIGDAIEAILFGAPDEVGHVRSIFEMLRTGRIDRSKFTENGNFYFTQTVLADYRSSLIPLGTPTSIAPREQPGLRGGLTEEQYILTFTTRKLLCVVRAEPATGRIEEFALYPFAE